MSSGVRLRITRTVPPRCLLVEPRASSLRYPVHTLDLTSSGVLSRVPDRCTSVCGWRHGAVLNHLLVARRVDYVRSPLRLTLRWLFFPAFLSFCGSSAYADVGVLADPLRPTIFRLSISGLGWPCLTGRCGGVRRIRALVSTTSLHARSSLLIFFRVALSS